MNALKAGLRKRWKLFAALVLIAFCLINYGVVYRSLYLVLFLGNVPASGWYTLLVENDCEEELIVTLYSLTDNEAGGAWRLKQMEFAGWHRQVATTLAPGEEDTLSLPIRVSDSTAVFLLLWRTEHDFRGVVVDQYMGAAIMRPSEDGYLRGRARDGQPVFRISALVSVHDLSFSTLDLVELLGAVSERVDGEGK